MSRKCAIVLVAITFLSLGTLIGTLIAPRPVAAAKEAVKIPPARTAFVNIAKVLRDYQKANQDGRKITKKRQEYIDKAKQLGEALTAKNQQITVSVNAMERELLEKQAIDLERQIEDLNKEAQRVIEELTDKTIVDVYQCIREIIADVAKQHELDVVVVYPDGSSPEDEKKPAVAQLKLQTPALIPFYLRKELDLTEEVIEKLNKKYSPGEKL